jgi:putative transposase
MSTSMQPVLTESFRPLPIITGLVGDALRSWQELVAETMMLRQQLIVASRKVDKPRFLPHERGLLVFLSSVVRRWREAVLLVKPDTIVRWHREGFRLLWSRKSRSRTSTLRTLPHPRTPPRARAARRPSSPRV